MHSQWEGQLQLSRDTVNTMNNIQLQQAAVEFTIIMYVCIKLLCHLSQEWTKLERPEGAPWPAERSSHAACCLNYGQDHPQVLVTGGADMNGNALSDMWILDVQSGRWREVSGNVHTNVWLVQSQHHLSLQFYSIWTRSKLSTN